MLAFVNRIADDSRRGSYFAEVHGFDTLTTQRGTDGRRGRCLASTDDELDHLVFCERFVCHDVWI